MARQPRIDYAGAWHHVMNRGVNRGSIFESDTDRRGFVGLLRIIYEKFAVETHAYALMGNHYHLLVRCPEASLSAAMHHLGGVYTQRFNHRHVRDGPVFRGRFRSTAVESEAQLLETARYVHRNPLELALDIRRYEWSSYPAYLDPGPRRPWLRRDLVIACAGGIDRLRRSVETDRPADKAQLADGKHSRLEGAEDSPAIPVERIDEVVLATTGEPISALTVSRPGRPNVTRDLALLLASDLTETDHASLARRYGFATPSGARTALQRALRRADGDSQLAQFAASARRRLLLEPGTGSDPATGQRAMA